MTTQTKTEPKQKSYFKKEVINRFQLDDKESFIEHRMLDEGLFQQYQDITSRIKFDREGESTEVDMALGKQRSFLLKELVTGWNLVDEDTNPVKFTPQRLFELPPEVISDLFEDIVNKNPILNQGEGDEEGKDKTK